MSWQNELLIEMMIWDLVDCPYHRSLCTRTSAHLLLGSHKALGYISIVTLFPFYHIHFACYTSFYAFPMQLWPLLAFYPWFTIIPLLFVFAFLMEILVVIAMFTSYHMLLLILVLGESWCSIAIYIRLLANTMTIHYSYLVFMLVICQVHYLCPLFAHMTWLPWLPLVRCIFALLACMTWFIWLLAWLHRPWPILAHCIGLIA